MVEVLVAAAVEARWVRHLDGTVAPPGSRAAENVN